jgi:hypothetical protein
MEYAQHILDKINKYCSKNRNALDGSKNIQDYVNDYDIVTSVEGVGCYQLQLSSEKFLFESLSALLWSGGEYDAVQGFYFFR